MPTGGTLRITLSRDSSGPEPMVEVAFADSGDGVSLEVLPRVFEPFFTTKEKGKGTGLGLAMVYGFVKQSRGHVTIYSEPGQGTTVRIYLPRHGSLPSEARPEDSAPAPAGTGQHVLLVEDDPLVRAYARGQLEALGYRVLQAADGPEALALLRGPAAVDLLFTDVVMPNMDGPQLAEEALRRMPKLKILYTTGYARNAVVHNGTLAGGLPVLSKPFTIDQLATKVAEVLHAG